MSPINITIETYTQVWQKMLKSNNYLQELYASIAMDVKKSTTIYETYMWVFHI